MKKEGGSRKQEAAYGKRDQKNEEEKKPRRTKGTNGGIGSPRTRKMKGAWQDRSMFRKE